MYNAGVRGIARTAVRPRLEPNLTTSTPLRSITQRTFSSTRSSTLPEGSTSFIFTSHARPSSSQTSTILQRLRSSIRFFHNSRARLNGKPTSPNPTANLNSPGGSAEPTSIGARLRKLSREYGWSAVGVYFALSALDFPFCYLLVRTLGTDRIGESNFCSYLYFYLGLCSV
jgi:hypothetical protein